MFVNILEEAIEKGVELHTCSLDIKRDLTAGRTQTFIGTETSGFGNIIIIGFF